MSLSEAKGQETGQHSTMSSKRRLFCQIFILFNFLNQKKSTIKPFPKVSQVLITLRAPTVLKMQALLLYWFAMQQQTRNIRRQNLDFFYSKLSADFKEVSFSFQRQQKVAKKWLKLNSQENCIYASFGGEGLRDRAALHEKLQKRFLLSYFDFFTS